jgi:adenylylsulfate kinase
LVVWITGISGAGKTVTARALVAELRALGHPVVHLDGDEVREIVGDNLGHSEPERIQNAFRLSRFCRFLHDQGLVVVCSTMSLYPEIWEWNRAHIKNYFEVFLKVSLETARLRDPKGHYGKGKDVVGVTLSLHEPKNPHLVLSGEPGKGEVVASNASGIAQALQKHFPSQLQ